SHRSIRNPTFEIGLITALPLEARAIIGLLDELYIGKDTVAYARDPADLNAYTAGRIGRHDVILMHMPRMGITSGAAVAMNALTGFPALKLILLVGICGGMPLASDETEIVLGDVIISRNIVQTNFGRQFPDGFVIKSDVESTFRGPSHSILSFLAKIEACTDTCERRMSEHLASLLELPEFGNSQYPGPIKDRLFPADYIHRHHNAQDCECARGDGACVAARTASCEELGCQSDLLIPRQRLQCQSGQSPVIHLGAFSSSDAVIKSGWHRDQIAKAANVIAFEMEGAGIWNFLPTVIVKGVCDYADSHKNKAWQRYAAATAAACAKILVE
ncbi:purine and uridine phosphorylase, partial [Aspergillus brunneoviolaceus CBS 621.78]